MNPHVIITRVPNHNKTTPDVIKDYFYRVEKSYVVDTVFNEMESNWVLPNEFEDTLNFSEVGKKGSVWEKNKEPTIKIVMGTDIATVENISISRNIITNKI